MDLTCLYKMIIEEIAMLFNSDHDCESKHLLKLVEETYRTNENSLILKMTQITILFEGFYQAFSEGIFKKSLQLIRAKRWNSHYGVPTITFLLTYKNEIRDIINVFSQLNTIDIKPKKFFEISESNLVEDSINGVLVNPESIHPIKIPDIAESTGIFTKTHNPLGGYTTTACDPVSRKFIAHAASIAENGGKVLEIGAAFGTATLQALEQGATVYCNDINVENLAVICKRYNSLLGQKNSITSDSNKLVLIPGALPYELGEFPKNQFEAILICRVLHFFSGVEIEESLSLLSKLLMPKGKLYIVCETPFLKNWQQFIPEFNKRVQTEQQWPGEIYEPALYESSGRASSLPKFVHWITKEVLDRSLLKTGFSIEHSEYINRKGQFSEDLLLPEYGRESIGAIGVV